MAFPADVKLVRVTCGTGYDFSGDPIAITLEVTPVLGGSLKRLIHAATGTFMTRDALTFKSDPGSPATFTVPSPAQAETWKDGSGEFFTNWSYSVTVTTRTASGKIQSWIQSFQPVDGQETVDLDLVPDGQIGSPTSAPAPAVTSVNGQSGAVVIDVGEAVTPESVAENLTVEAVDAKLPERLSESALSATIGESVAVSPDVIPSTVLKLTANPPVGFRGFSVLPTPKIRRSMQGVFTAELDIEALRPPAGVTYYTNPTASASADGLTPATASRISTIVAKPDVGTIICADGEYRRDIVANPAGGIPRSINWLAAPGAKPIFTGFNGVTATAWTLTSGNIYQTTRAATTSVLDVQNLTPWGDYTIYVKKADLASVTGPGQWSLVGSTVYVWAIGSPDLSAGEARAQIRLQVSATSGVVAGAGTTQYIEGIDFLGCASDTSSSVGGVVAQENSLVIAKNVRVKYNMASDGFTTRGGHMVAVDCESSSNDRDGMNYHDTPGNGGEFIEINCYSHHNGITTPGTNNATTAHEAVTGIRVNGNYDKSAGPVVVDVNSAHTWNIGCYSGGTYAGLPADAGSWVVDASSYPTNPAKMWLDECISDTALYAYRAGGENCKLYTHASGWGNPMRTDTPAFVTSYRRT